MTAFRTFFPKLGHFLTICKKGLGRGRPSFPPSSYVPVFVTKRYFGISQNNFSECLIILCNYEYGSGYRLQKYKK